MAEIPVVKHNNPIKLADGNYHLYPTTIDLVKMPDGSTPAFDMESESWNAVDSMRLGGKPASEYATKEDLEGLPSSGSGVPDGGSAGQTLVKQSDEDGDAEWATPNLMDMEYIDPENETTDEEGNILLTDAEKLGGKLPSEYATSDHTHNADAVGALGKNDTAKNSEKLGGELPEHYATAERLTQLSQQIENVGTPNLLVNSNFQAPYLINLLGLTEYSGGKGGALTLNEWRKDAATIVAVSDDCIVLSGNDNGFYQIIPDDLLKRISGNVCTMAIMVKKANDSDASVRFGVGGGGGYGSFELTSEWTIIARQYTYDYTNYPNRNNVVIRPIGNISVKWTALYEGVYTAENFPTPIWLHPRLEMIRMGLPVNPVNLLDNSDFVNPVNQRGLTSYDAPSGAPDNIDRWYANRATVTVDGDGISVIRNTSDSTKATYIGQKMKDVNRFIGQTLTMAFLTDKGLFVGSWTSFADVDATVFSGQGWKISYSKTATAFVLQTTSESSIKLYWATLYEGAFTAETLPPYVPKGYANELLACKVAKADGKLDADMLGGKPPEAYTAVNLLDNSDFRNPVNQRGQTAYLVADGYTIDRWKITGTAGELNKFGVVSGQYCAISDGSGGSKNVWAYQMLPVGLLADGAKATFAIMQNGGIIKVLNINSWGTACGYDYDDGVSLLYQDNSIVILNGTGKPYGVVWAALYEGEYTVETLPPYVPKGYAAELSECLRYFEVLGEWNYNSYSDLDFTFNHHPKVSSDITRTVVSKTGTQGKIGKYSGGWSDMNVSYEGSTSTTRIMAYGGAGIYGFKRIEISADL